MRIWGPHKKIPNPDSRIRIRRHSPLVWYDSRIWTSSGSGIICIFCFDEFFYGSGPKDPEPGSRHTQQLYKKFKHDILEEKWVRATFRWTHVCFFLDFSFKKDAVPGLRIETRIQTEVRIRVSALAPVP